MAALDFPPNPTNGQTFTSGGVSYYYNSAIGSWLTSYVATPMSQSSNTQIMYNDAGTANGSNGLVFNKSANTLSINNLYTTANVSIGINEPSAPLHIASSTTLVAGSPSVILSGNNNTERVHIRAAGVSGTIGQPVFGLFSARGTYSTPTSVQTGDPLGYYQLGGYDGSGWIRGAWIQGIAAENYSSTNRGTSISFSTTPVGSTTIGEVMRLSGNGNVGVGTTSPNTQFEISRAVGAYWSGSTNTFTSRPQALTITNTYGGGYDAVLMFRQADQGALNIKDAGAIGMVGTASWSNTDTGQQTSDMYFLVKNNANGISERMRITSAGSVGIGTTNPQYKIHLANGNFAVTSSTGAGTFQITDDSDSSRGLLLKSNHGGTSNTYVGTNSAVRNLVFGIDQVERARIDTSGNFLVGTTTGPSGGLQIAVVGSSTNRGYYIMGRTTAATSGVCGSLLGYNAAQPIASMDFASNGATNSGFIQMYTWSAGSAVGGPYVNTGGTSWTTASDERLKTIIGPIQDALSKVMTLRNIHYYLKSDENKTERIGFIAQDMEKVLPEVISQDRDGMLGIDYATVTPLLAAAIQELKAEFDAYKATHP